MRESTKEFFQTLFGELGSEEQLKAKLIEQQDEIYSLKLRLDGTTSGIPKEIKDTFVVLVEKMNLLEKQRDEYKALLEEKQKAIELHSIEVADLEKHLNRALHFMHTYKDYADYFQDLYEKLKQTQG
jgi:ribosomal protein L23